MKPKDAESQQHKNNPLNPYVERIVKAVNYKGSKDREDVPSILKELLQDAQRAEGLQARVNTLYEAADLVHDMPLAYNRIWKRRQGLLPLLNPKDDRQDGGTSNG